MLNKGGNVLIHIKTGNRPYLINKSESSHSLAAGTVLAAFGRGCFKRQTGGEADDPRKEVKFCLSGPEQQLLHNGALTTLGDLVEQRRKAGPSPVIKLSYHTLTDKPVEGKPGHFEISQTHDVRFVPAGSVTVENEGGSDNTASQMNLASLLPIEAWDSTTASFFGFNLLHVLDCFGYLMCASCTCMSVPL